MSVSPETKVERLSEAQLDQIAVDAAQRAHPVFVACGWTYGEEVVPSEGRLALTVRRLLGMFGDDLDDPDRTISSGRFSVSRWVGGTEEVARVRLELRHSYER